MGKFDDVLLASDFDNTILNTERPRRTGGPIPPVSQGNLTAIRYFMAEGGRFAVATGRALPAFRMFADKVPMNAPAIVCNGAVLDRFPTAAAEAYHLDNVIHAVRPNEFTRQHQHVTHAGVEAVDDLWAVPLPLVKLMFEDEHTRLLPLRDWIFAQPWSERYEVFFSNPTLLEVTGKGAGKGAMVRRLAARLGISMAHTYCVGDEANDLSMLQAAAEGFAPGNCAEAVRQSGATLVVDCDHDTLADVVSIVDSRY